MKISIDTREDSHEEIKKVISMLQNLVGGSGEIFSNDSSISAASNSSPIANIFGDSSSVSSSAELASSSETAESAVAPSSAEANEAASQSTEDLFAELFSEEELKKMEPVKEPEDEDEEEELKSKAKPKSKKPDIEFY